MALRDALDDTTRAAVMKVSRIFKRLCAWEIKIADCVSDLTDAAEALSLIEKVFPPTFMDVMSHLLIHLVEVSTKGFVNVFSHTVLKEALYRKPCMSLTNIRTQSSLRMSQTYGKFLQKNNFAFDFGIDLYICWNEPCT
jgi:hypothetical protein